MRSRSAAERLLTCKPLSGGGSLWITVFRNMRECRIGLFLSYHRESRGERIASRIFDDLEKILEELGEHAIVRADKLGRRLIEDEHSVRSLTSPEPRDAALRWLRDRCNDFINTLRPRIRAAVADIQDER